MISVITRWTNQKISQVKEKFATRQGFTYETKDEEIKALLGILILLGATKSSKESTSSIWAEDGTGKPLCIAAISKKRFVFLLYCLRFDDCTSRNESKLYDKLAPIRELYEEFVKSCVSNYSPSANCTVDEFLLGFRGRCGFKVYIPNKPAKYGIKVYVLANNESSYCIKSKVYLGKGTHNSNFHLPIPTQAVLELTDCLNKTNRNITIIQIVSTIIPQFL